MKRLKAQFVAGAMALLSGIMPIMAEAAASAPGTVSAPAAEAGPRREAIKWFQDAKFGIFLHWGLYSEIGGANIRGYLTEWIMQNQKIPADKYEQLADFFNPTKFDAKEWVRSFKAAGANYVVITAKHHDGFAMYDSKVSPYNIVKATPFARDPIAELAAECHKNGIKLFFYYSQVDWHHPDYYPLGETGQAAGRPAGTSESWDKYIDYQNAQLRELLTQYGPIGGIWFDGWWDQKNTPMRDRWRLKETYDLIHSLQPNALIVNNHHHAPFPGEDYQVFERDLPGANSLGLNEAGISNLPLEMAETMNGSWGFSLTDDKAKSLETLIRTMVGAAGRNANFLLNTGPRPDGLIQPGNVKTLQDMGQWMKRYGESIYGTRGGPITPRSWGATTQKGNMVYIHVLDWSDPTLFVPLIGPIAGITDMTTGKPAAYRTVSGGIEISGAALDEGMIDRVFAVTR